MRIFEFIFITLLVLASVITFFIGQRRQYRNNENIILFVIPGSLVISATIGICLEGFRLVMGLLYLLGLVVIIIFLMGKRREGIIGKNQFLEKQIPESKVPTKKNSILKSFGIIVFYMLFLASITIAWFLPVANLPKPSGASAVGTMMMDFTNPSRTNILTNKKEVQKIGVQVWYPASDSSGKKYANWMNNPKVSSLFTEKIGLPEIFGQLCLAKTNSYLNASISNESENYPVVLFSGGGGMFNAQNTIQMEELASHGYLVFAVSHPYDDFATIYSDGTVLPSSEQLSSALSDDTLQAINTMKSHFSEGEATPEMQRMMINEAKLSNQDVQVWAEDFIFLADQIEKMNEGSIASSFKGRIDTSKMGIFGHSFGGAAAGQACLTDKRFKAFINIDGSPFGDSVNHVIKQPFMVLEAGSDSNMKFKASDGYSSNQKNYLVVSVEGTQHMNFTDLNTVIPRIGKVLGALGRIDSKEQTKITNAYVLAFFEHYLKGSQQPILEKEDSPFAEVNLSRK